MISSGNDRTIAGNAVISSGNDRTIAGEEVIPSGNDLTLAGTEVTSAGKRVISAGKRVINAGKTSDQCREASDHCREPGDRWLVAPNPSRNAGDLARDASHHFWIDADHLGNVSVRVWIRSDLARIDFGPNWIGPYDGFDVSGRRRVASVGRGIVRSQPLVRVSSLSSSSSAPGTPPNTGAGTMKENT